MLGRRPLPMTRRGRPSAGLVACLAAVALAGCDDRPQAAGPIRILGIIGEVGQSPGQFIYPRAIDSDGSSLWVVDKSARVQRLDPGTGDPLCGWQMPDSELGKPVGVTIAPGSDGRSCVYVPDTHYHRVLVYRAPSSMGEEPELLKQIGSFGEGPGQFIYPTDVAVLTGPDGRPERIFVAEYGGHDRVNAFDRDWNFLFSFGSMGDSADPGNIQFDRPQAIEIDTAAREVVVVDSSNHRLGRFTLDGKLVAWIGSPQTAGTELGQFRYPYGLCLLDGRTALVAEFGNNRVQLVDLATGAGLAGFGQGGRDEGSLVTPWGITVLGDMAYVLDSGNNRVQAFAAPRARAGGGRG
jgi:iron(III) transport system ATP-binding protein